MDHQNPHPISLRLKSLAWLGIFLALLGITTAACVFDPQALIDQLIAQLIEDIENEINETIDAFEQAINDWWQALLENIENAWVENWENIQQTFIDLWNSAFPKPPIILSPGDVIWLEQEIAISGTGLPEGTLELRQNDQITQQTKVDAEGNWRIDAVQLNQGESIFAARVKGTLIRSGWSNEVTVIFPGSSAGYVPAMSPPIDDNYDQYSWMLALALAELSAGGNNFYEENAQAYMAALRQGLKASEADYIAHRYINPEMPLSFDKYAMVFLVPAEESDAAILEAFAEAIGSAIWDEGVQEEILVQIQQSFTRLAETWEFTDSGVTHTFQYVRIDLDRHFILQYLDPSGLAKFRVSMTVGLLENLAGAVSQHLVEETVKMLFSLWGTADADIQAQRYFDIAIRAWNHQALDGTPLAWADPANNGYDGDFSYEFETNEEWAMFYLGRAAFYAQTVADPYYTIPYYTPEADAYSFFLGQTAEAMAEALVAKKVAPVFGRVVGGANPVTVFFLSAEIFEWMKGYMRYLDATAVRDEHSPNFIDFVNGIKYASDMPAEYLQFGSQTELWGYPYRFPSDLLVRYFIDSNGLTLQHRSFSTPLPQFDGLLLLNEWQEQSQISPQSIPIQTLVRNVGLRAAEFVDGGYSLESERRLTEGDFIYGNPFLVREIYSCTATTSPNTSCWDAGIGDEIQMIWFDGAVLEGTVSASQVTEEFAYVDGRDRLSETPLHLLQVERVQYISEQMNQFSFSTADIWSVVGDENHVYVTFDTLKAYPNQIADSKLVPSVIRVLVGINGNRNLPPDNIEYDGMANIAVDRLLAGTTATSALLALFSAEADRYEPPLPVAVGPDDLVLVLGSPADLHLFDADGQHVGLNASGEIDLEIPGSFFFTQPITEKQVIYVAGANAAANYEIQVDGQAQGSFDLDVYYPDWSQEQAVHLVYEDIPLTELSMAELSLYAEQAGVLDLDMDSDGIVDDQFNPIQVTTVPIIMINPRRNIPFFTILIFVVLAGFGLLFVRVYRRRRANGSKFLYAFLVGAVLLLTGLLLIRTAGEEGGQAALDPQIIQENEVEAEGSTIPTNTPDTNPLVAPSPSLPTVEVIVGAANVRSGPSVDFKSISIVERGTVLDVLATDTFRSWYLVELENGQKGWIGSSVVAESPEIEEAPIAVTVPAMEQ